MEASLLSVMTPLAESADQNVDYQIPRRTGLLLTLMPLRAANGTSEVSVLPQAVLTDSHLIRL